MEIKSTANANAVGSTGNTSNNTAKGKMAKPTAVDNLSNSPYSRRLMSRIASSKALSGTEKNNLIETVSLIDKLKSGKGTLRSKLLKDVAGVTSYLEKIKVNTQPEKVTIKQPQQVNMAKIEARVAKEVEKQKPDDNKIEVSVSQQLERIVQDVKDTLKREAKVSEFSMPGSGEPLSKREESNKKSLDLPGSNPDPIDVSINGVGKKEARLVEIQIPGSGDSMVANTGQRQVETSEFANNTVVSKILDKLI